MFHYKKLSLKNIIVFKKWVLKFHVKNVNTFSILCVEICPFILVNDMFIAILLHNT